MVSETKWQQLPKKKKKQEKNQPGWEVFFDIIASLSRAPSSAASIPANQPVCAQLSSDNISCSYRRQISNCTDTAHFNFEEQ